MRLSEIIDNSMSVFTELDKECKGISDQKMFYQPDNKWSVAQNVKHLIISTNSARLAFSLPKIVVRIAGGVSNRPSQTYEEIVSNYKSKLAEGGKASGRYDPEPVKQDKQSLLGEWQGATHHYLEALQKHLKNETVLDRYQAPHPLLGKMTLRELCYFTIYHTEHHLIAISKILSDTD